MKAKSGLVILTLTLAALCTFAFAKDSQIQMSGMQDNAALLKKMLKIRVGVSTHEDVVRLLGPPWRSTNDADCQATQYGEVWEYLAHDASGPVRIHIAFSKAGKASLVARIPQKGNVVVLAFTPESKEHQH